MQTHGGSEKATCHADVRIHGRLVLIVHALRVSRERDTALAGDVRAGGHSHRKTAVFCVER
jgi:hypothetical protein